nr:DNA recombination/repair protein RecA [Polyangiaceae bacterium]
MSLASLRQQLATIVAPELPAVPGSGLPTGIAALDAVLSGGGLPRGRLTEIVGGRGSGKTTLVREIVAQALADKRWVAYVDAGRTLAPADWAALAASGRLWIVRPPPATATPTGGRQPGAPGDAGTWCPGAWCADVLLRSGAFGLVVLDGAGALAPGVAIRLTRLARESQAAFVVLREEEDEGDPHARDMRGRPGRTRMHGVVGGAVRLRVRRQGTAGTGGAPPEGRPAHRPPGDSSGRRWTL